MTLQRSYEGKVSEAAAIGTTVLRLGALDADGDDVVYGLSGPIWH